MPKPLMQSLPEVDERIRAVDRLALFLDFDGTLAPIVDDPAVARMSSDVCAALRNVALQEGIVTTIISGRAVEDVYARVRVDGLIYAGNHGMEIFGRNLSFVDPAANSCRDWIRRVVDEIAMGLQGVPGVLVEDRGLTASIHFRQAAEQDWPAIEAQVRATVATAGPLFRLNSGRKVFEIVPRTGWNKGAAVQWILERLGVEGLLPIYVGDDNSDEDAFVVLPDAITVRVAGNASSSANYAVPSPSEVHKFLLWLEGVWTAT